MAGSRLAAFQSASSAACVPDLSPRETNGLRAVADRLERGEHVLAALDLGRIGLRPDQDEVVVHDVEALHAEAVGDELLLLGLGVHEDDVGIAAAAGVERLARCPAR